MKRHRKLISIIIAGIMLIGSMPAFANGQTDFADTGFALAETMQSDDLG